MKKLLAIIALMVSITANAYDFMVDGIAYNITSIENRTVEVTSKENKYTGDIVIPETVSYSGYNFTVTVIGYSAFNGCYDLWSVQLPNTITVIDNCAFANCRSLYTINIPNSVTDINNEAFFFSGISSLIIPNSMNSINSRVFYGCSNLKSVTIPNSITSLGSEVFDKCTSLVSVYIPNSVSNVYNNAFANCINLDSVIVNWHQPLSINKNVFEEVSKTTCKIFVPIGTKSLYENADVWKEFWNIIEQGEDPQPKEKCASPEINYYDGALHFSCQTENATIKYKISGKDISSEYQKVQNGIVPLQRIYIVSAYASADGYADSDDVTKEIEVAPASKFPKGDVNEDGKVDVADITATATIILSDAKNEIELVD